MMWLEVLLFTKEPTVCGAKPLKWRRNSLHEKSAMRKHLAIFATFQHLINAFKIFRSNYVKKGIPHGGLPMCDMS
jgi:hypothetical protein